MEDTDRRTRSASAFMLVMLLHCVLIAVLIRTSKQVHFNASAASKALLIYFLPRAAPAVDVTVTSERAAKESLPGLAPFIAIQPPAAPTPTPTPAPEVPPIDWQKALELVAASRISEADKNDTYRDLSKSMSASQLDWLKNHHMEPSNPGLTWKSPRVEITKEGLPIVHINDHCVLVPMFLIPMVFCSIGHIEPNGELFKHMEER